MVNKVGVILDDLRVKFLINFFYWLRDVCIFFYCKYSMGSLVIFNNSLFFGYILVCMYNVLVICLVIVEGK